MLSVGSPAGTVAAGSGPSKSRARAGTESLEAVSRQYPATTKPLPLDPRYRTEKSYHSQPSANKISQRPTSSQRDMAPPTRPPKDFPHSVSDSTSAFGQAQTSIGRPNTGGSMTSSGQGRLPSRGNSYSQPLAPTVAATNAQGRVTQPKSENKYNISAPMPMSEPYMENASIGRPSTQRYGTSPRPTGQRDPSRTHKRSNTLGNFFRTGSISGPRAQPPSPVETPQREKKYPPTSMKNPIASDSSPRQSIDSRRPSFSLSRKNRENSDISKQEKPRRFSLLPASFSFKSLTGVGAGRDGSSEYRPASERRQSNAQNQIPSNRMPSRPQTMSYQKGQNGNFSIAQERDETNEYDGQREEFRAGSALQSRSTDYVRGSVQPQQTHFGSSRYPNQRNEYPPPAMPPTTSQSYLGTPAESETSLVNRQYKPVYPPGFGSEDQEDRPPKSTQQSRPARGPAVLTKSNRRFADAYEVDQQPGSGSGHHAGSSGAAKRVMDFFRRRGKARTGEERA